MFKLSIFDALVFISILYYVVRYDYELQLANWKVIYAVSLLILWFTLRILLANVILSRAVLFGGIVFIGCSLTIYGLFQLYGFQSSNHRLFAITGPFYNPGPYSGYLAMILPISLSCLISSIGKIRYLWLSGFALILCILPAGMSRSAWLAIFISCIWVLAIHYNWIEKAKNKLCKHRYKTFLYGTLLIFVIIFASVLLFRMKVDSANGRLFMWKITYNAVIDNPLLGYGAGTFPHVYGEAQSSYFAAGNYTAEEEKVAGAPEYAFNEYLQLLIEGGFVLLVLFLTLVIWAILKGVSNKEYAACSGLISLLIFSFSSYPFQILPFSLMGVLLLVICISSSTNKITKSHSAHFVVPIILIAALLTGNTFCLYKLRNTHELSKRVYYVECLQNQDLLKEASIGYSRLYQPFKHNSVFLTNYAKCLFQQRKYAEAITVLERAKLVSCHPSIYNLQGLYYQALDNLEEAEKCYVKSTNLLPIRIYPYYLLAKLYADSSFYHQTKMEEMADIVLLKEPKIFSNAIYEMRIEMDSLLKKTIN